MTINATDRPGELRDDHERAHAQLHRLDQEYAAMLADPGVLQEDRDSVRTLLEAARRTFDAAQAALDQLASGTYGQCLRCGGPIGAERLEALPGATMCVACQSRS